MTVAVARYARSEIFDPADVLVDPAIAGGSVAAFAYCERDVLVEAIKLQDWVDKVASVALGAQLTVCVATAAAAGRMRRRPRARWRGL